MSHAKDNELDLSDIVAHHSLAVHGSGANLSGAVKSIYIIQ